MNGDWLVLYRPELESIDKFLSYDLAKTFKNVFREDVDRDHWLFMFYDGLRAHITVQVVKLFLDAKIAIMALPAHTSHKLQPLDVSLFCSFNHFIRLCLHEWTSHFLLHGILHEHYLAEICAAIKYTHNASFTVPNIKSAFEKNSNMAT